jgi:hypothetical protein
MDRDEHANFDDAVRTATQCPDYGQRLRLVRSYPCFEIWLVYHFEFHRGPCNRGQALERAKALIPNYEKADVQCIESLIPRLDDAIRNSRRALIDAEQTDAPNPSTEMHKLVSDFMRMAS